MQETPLYLQIAHAIRDQILSGELTDGQQLPTVRELAERWGCAPGTVQRAYSFLSREGWVHGKAGHGTRVVAGAASGSPHQGGSIALANEVDEFLSALHAEGYTTGELERALWFGLDRLRASPREDPGEALFQINFVGSHDPLITPLAQSLRNLEPGYRMQVRFVGSLRGLMALAQGEADVAGCHLWDPDSDTYNEAYVRRLFPGRRAVLVTLTHRRFGLIVEPGNPRAFQSVEDFLAPDTLLINRQAGAGTRVWLDAQLAEIDLTPDQIEGYGSIAYTHSEVCAAISEGKANVGVGIESAAVNYGLDFVPLTMERYDLVFDGQRWEAAPVQSLLRIVQSKPFLKMIEHYTGYDTSETGKIHWVHDQ